MLQIYEHVESRDAIGYLDKVFEKNKNKPFSVWLSIRARAI